MIFNDGARSRLRMALFRGGDSLNQIFLDMDEVDYVKQCECGRCKHHEESQ